LYFLLWWHHTALLTFPTIYHAASLDPNDPSPLGDAYSPFRILQDSV
jgi:hypothetical protein